MEKTIERLEKIKEKLRKDIDNLSRIIDKHPLTKTIYDKIKLELNTVNNIQKMLFSEYSKERMKKMGY